MAFSFRLFEFNKTQETFYWSSGHCIFWDWMCVFVMSILRQYLVVVFRDKPLELWDIRTGTLLREMAKNFPTVTALVLTNLHTDKNMVLYNPLIWGAKTQRKNKCCRNLNIKTGVWVFSCRFTAAYQNFSSSHVHLPEHTDSAVGLIVDSSLC